MKNQDLQRRVLEFLDRLKAEYDVYSHALVLELCAEVEKLENEQKELKIELDPADREWEYDGDGVKRYKSDFRLYP